MNEHPAIAALRKTAPSIASPLPWSIEHSCIVDARGSVVDNLLLKADRKHIAAAVNAAPHLLAEIDRLRAQLAAAREAMLRPMAHDTKCVASRALLDPTKCICGVQDRWIISTRLALGLEVAE